MSKTIVITGRVCNPQEKEIKGKPVMEFAINNGKKDAPDWHNFILWEGAAEMADIQKGDTVTVTASEYMSTYEKDGETVPVRRWGRVSVDNHDGLKRKFNQSDDGGDTVADDSDLPF